MKAREFSTQSSKGWVISRGTKRDANREGKGDLKSTGRVLFLRERLYTWHLQKRFFVLYVLSVSSRLTDTRRQEELLSSSYKGYHCVSKRGEVLTRWSSDRSPGCRFWILDSPLDILVAFRAATYAMFHPEGVSAGSCVCPVALRYGPRQQHSRGMPGP